MGPRARHDQRTAAGHAARVNGARIVTQRQGHRRARRIRQHKIIIGAGQGAQGGRRDVAEAQRAAAVIQGGGR